MYYVRRLPLFLIIALMASHHLCAQNRFTFIEHALLGNTFALKEHAVAAQKKEPFAIPQFSVDKKIQLLITHLAQDETTNPLFTSSITTPETWDNLDLFPRAGIETPCVASATAQPISMTGKITLAALLTDQTSDPTVIAQRQAFIKRLVDDETYRTRIRTALTQFAQTEDRFISLTQKNDPLYGNIIEALHYKNQFASNTPTSLETWRRVLEVLSVLAVAGLPLSFLNIAKNLPATVKAYKPIPHIGLAGVGITLIYLTLKAMKERRNAGLYIRKRARDVVGFLNLLSISKKSEISDLHPPAFTTNPLPQHIFSRINTESAHYFRSSMGHSLASQPHLKENRKNIARGIRALGLLDAYVALAETMVHQTKERPWCFIETISDAQSPRVSLTDYWHPMVSEPTLNSINLGGNARKDALITGPNAGGKSTNIKAITLALAIGQAVGIAPARSAQFTPFTLIRTYLNITDDLASENSLFIAELKRAHRLITQIKSLPPSQFSFVAMDEILRSTNPEEGESGAYGITRHISEQPNSMLLLATHYFGLTQLANIPGSSVANYHVSATVDEDGTITFPFTLLPGTNKQNIALNLLARDGITPELVSKAQNLLTQKAFS